LSPAATPAEISVRRVIHATATCVFTLVVQDPSSLGKQEIKPFPTYYQLGLNSAEEGQGASNPTPWMIVADGEPLPGGKEYANPCT
jgi:hypothetical protein